MVEDIVDRKDNAVIEKLYDRLVGRFSKEDICDTETGELLLASDQYITEDMAKKIVDAGVKQAYIRNTFTCESTHGVCQMCYGRNLVHS